MRDFLWGNDVGTGREIARLALKVCFSLALAWMLHELLARSVFFQRVDPTPMANHVNRLLCSNGIPVKITIWWEQQSNFDALAYTLRRHECPSVGTDARNTAADNAGAQSQSIAAQQAQAEPSDDGQPGVQNGVQGASNSGDFYRLWEQVVTHPQVTDSIHVLVRRVEQVWRSKPGQDVLLCAESRKPLPATDCARTEAFRKALEHTQDQATDASAANNQLTHPKLSIDDHLRKIKLGSLVLGPWQWLTLGAFFFASLEVLGLWSRWVHPKSYVSKLVSGGLETPLSMEDRASFEKHLAIASSTRVRGLVDRFLEKGLSPSRTPAESRLRNFRDMLIDDCVSRVDTLESIGDTMLKIAFMGTVFGIGTALFAARSLDAADPLIRLVAKSEMYAGIGMGFGATLVGIFLSILAAKLRAWLSSSWLSAIDDAWRRATMFYDANFGSSVEPVAIEGVSGRRLEYREQQRSPVDKFIDAFLTTLGYVGVLALIAYLAHTFWFRFGGG
jgi:hypothetical protein